MFGAFAQNTGKRFIRWRHPDACIDHKKADIGHIHCPLCQFAHSSGQAFVCGILKSCRVNHRKAQIAKARLPLTQITRNAGLIIHKGQFFPDKTVE